MNQQKGTREFRDFRYLCYFVLTLVLLYHNLSIKNVWTLSKIKLQKSIFNENFPRFQPNPTRFGSILASGLHQFVFHHRNS